MGGGEREERRTARRALNLGAGDAVVRWSGSPPTHCTLPGLEALGVGHAFTTRHQGSFNGVLAPGGPFGTGRPWPALGAAGIAPDDVRYARQVHGAVCLDGDRGGPGLVGTGDALYTTARGRPLAVFTADCVPLVIVDPVRPALGLAHAGWRGTVQGIAGRLISTLVDRAGARPERLRAAIGPSIGPCCYEVDEPVTGPLRAAFPEVWTRWVRPGRPGKWWLDLWAANAWQLEAAGVPPDGVWSLRLCTSCRADLFYSYRREGLAGRLATLAVLR
jgi:YfiH family protein